MGFSPIGGNNKPRSTILFKRQGDLLLYKNGTADIAEASGASPSDVVLRLVLNGLAKTVGGQKAAAIMYCAETPHCLDVYKAVFDELAALGEPEQLDAKNLVQSFLRHSLDFSLCLNTSDDRIYRLRNQWDSIARVIARGAESTDVGAMLTVKNIKELQSALETETAMQPIYPLISAILQNWPELHEYSCTYRALVDCAYMAFSTRNSAVENAETRLALLRKVDEYYSGGREGSE